MLGSSPTKSDELDPAAFLFVDDTAVSDGSIPTTAGRYSDRPQSSFGKPRARVSARALDERRQGRRNNVSWFRLIPISSAMGERRRPENLLSKHDFFCKKGLT